MSTQRFKCAACKTARQEGQAAKGSDLAQVEADLSVGGMSKPPPGLRVSRAPARINGKRWKRPRLRCGHEDEIEEAAREGLPSLDDIAIYTDE